jgi:TatD DNase family protein
MFIGLNGIMTFTKDVAQLEAAKNVPLEKLLLETDAPFLTPAPFRGKINSPQYVVEIAEFLAALRGERFADFSRITY